MTITKSQFVAGVQCLKRLYWQVHEPESAEVDASASAVLKQGWEVGLLARQLFPGGVEVRGNTEEAICTTQELLANPLVPAIFEAAFHHDGVVVRVDILHRRKDRRWRLIEVKSSTKLKETNLDDIAIQSRTVRGAGVDLASSCLAHVNRNYVFSGGTVDPWRFFRIRNVTRQVQGLQSALSTQLRSAFTTLSMPNVPDIAPGRHCVSPVMCEFFDRCNPPVPDDHIGYLPLLHASTEEKLEEMGVQSIHDIPDDYPLSERQRRACATVQTGETWVNPLLGEAMESLCYPLYFMDFESVNPAIPRFPGTRPYDQIPFQWSVHVLREPSQQEPGHYEFLATNASDPRPEFIASLCAVMGQSGSIVVYSQQFESKRLSDLATNFPEFAEQIERIQTRLWDLLPVVKNNVYHPTFMGSFSLKAVLPALVPHLTYQGMEVGNGQEAGLAWESLVHGDLDCNERDRIRKALLEYCGQDTLALVKLLGKLRQPDAC